MSQGPYADLLMGVVRLVEQAPLAAVRFVNVVLTSTYWLVGQRIVEHEQSGSERAAYGQTLLERLAQDLTAQLVRGFSERNLEQPGEAEVAARIETVRRLLLGLPSRLASPAAE